MEEEQSTAKAELADDYLWITCTTCQQRIGMTLDDGEDFSVSSCGCGLQYRAIVNITLYQRKEID